MRRAIAFVLALALALGMSACAKGNGAAQPPDTAPQGAAQEPAQPQDEVWRWALTTEKKEASYTADDGTVIAERSYEQPLLTLANEAGETFAGGAPERGVTAEQLAVCKTFNDATGSTGLWETDLEEQGREIYEWRRELQEDMPPVCEEVAVADSRLSGDLLSVLAGDYINLGGAHPDYGLHSWNYDLAKGAFFGLMSLTDRPDELRQALVNEIAAQIDASEERDGYFENWYETLSQKTEFEVWFGAQSMLVWFQEYELAPHALGVPQFGIPYGTVSRFLNADGERLLDLPAEVRAVGDFHEAQARWSWLEGGAPLDYTDSRTGTVNGFALDYYRVDSPDVRTLGDLRAWLSAYVDRAFVDGQLAQSDVFRESDGVLRAASVGRGDDLTIASVDFAAQLDASGGSGRVTVTIHRQDYDDATGEWVPTGVSETHEFPFALRGGHAVFETMESIY